MTERREILDLLEDGIINAEEANQLLLALDVPEAPGGGTPGRADERSEQPASLPVEPAAPSTVPSGMDRFRRLSQIPFAIALAMLVLSGWGLYAVYRQAAGRVTLGVIGMLFLFVIVIIVTVTTLWMMTAPWLHLRLQNGQGKRIAISVPLPLTLADWGVSLAQRFVDDKTAGYLDTAAQFVATMREEQAKKGSQPIVVDIDEEDEHVQVYIG